jgi:hypothetical protein
MKSPDGGVVMARPGKGCRMSWFNRKVALLALNIGKTGKSLLARGQMLTPPGFQVEAFEVPATAAFLLSCCRGRS